MPVNIKPSLCMPLDQNKKEGMIKHPSMITIFLLGNTSFITLKMASGPKKVMNERNMIFT
ncbi:MAG: hypothetical protein BWZ05_02289 [Bacteroidetes bacterium ADurb.BinA245]|jgi:hypothetical protein|nr:MAG: hypothetical protein BWZ05_02289 [Bacteroidetes bacterium ADurb.BinA245]